MLLSKIIYLQQYAQYSNSRLEVSHFMNIDHSTLFGVICILLIIPSRIHDIWDLGFIRVEAKQKLICTLGTFKGIE